MLTFEQALLQLKSGHDMRWTSWPAGTFARAVVTLGSATPELKKFAARPGGSYLTATYTPTQAEIFGNQWTAA